jgi:hypothetical protein
MAPKFGGNHNRKTQTQSPMKKDQTTPQRAAKSPRKQARSHYDGEIESHPDGTFTCWIAAQGKLGKPVAQGAAKLGITLEQFLHDAMAAKAGYRPSSTTPK